MQMKSTHSFIFWHKSASLIYLVLFIATPSIAEESLLHFRPSGPAGCCGAEQRHGEGRTGLDRKDQDRHVLSHLGDSTPGSKEDGTGP